MSGELEYSTIESSRSVLHKLYENDHVNEFTECTIVVPVAEDDRIIYRELKLHLHRLFDKSHIRVSKNKNRTFETKAKFDPDGNEFDVDVVIRFRNSFMQPATIILSEEANDEAIRILLFEE